MTTPQTLPLPVTPSALRHAHEHAWLTDSAHRTSEGVVTYVRCAGCAARRVDLRGRDEVLPSALSRPSRHG